MSEAWTVIMAGGVGARFWPLSRRARPKQLLALGPTGDSLLAATLGRIAPVVPAARAYVVTSEALAAATRAAVPEVPGEQVLAEPVGRNTAPCVGWAAAHVARRDPSGVLAILPADHHVGDEPAFRAVIERAIDAARDGDIVTVGVRPTRPETGYGYVEVADEIAAGVHRAARFVEKPDHRRAEQFLADGRYLWNSGMFFFRADVILAAIHEHLPDLGRALAEYDAAAAAGDEAALVAATYADLPSVSIDHGVMEKVSRVAVVPGDFGWSDLGSWTTAWELSTKDSEGNAAPAGAVLLDARGNYVRAPAGKCVALVGVEGLVVVDTEDALLVVPRERAQDVRAVVDALAARGDERR